MAIWGASWADAWGESWASVDTPTPPPTPSFGGGGLRFVPELDLPRRPVVKKRPEEDEAILLAVLEL